jgi:hypothetical protein
VVHCFRIKQNTTRVPERNKEMDCRLEQNYPNPFNSQTTISFTLFRSQHVLLTVYDLAGRLVATIVDQSLAAGIHRLTFSAIALPSGVYVYKLKTAEAIRMQKMVVLM